jgi:hypothetical protein
MVPIAIDASNPGIKSNNALKCTLTRKRTMHLPYALILVIYLPRVRKV